MVGCLTYPQFLRRYESGVNEVVGIPCRFLSAQVRAARSRVVDRRGAAVDAWPLQRAVP